MQVVCGVSISVSFILSIFAAIVAVQLYSLLRTGELGKTWRVLTVAVVILTLRSVIAFGERLQLIPELSAVVELLSLAFVAVLCYALWLQRQAFFIPNRRRNSLRRRVLARPSNATAATMSRTPTPMGQGADTDFNSQTC